VNELHIEIITSFREKLLDSIKDQFVGKDEIIELLGISLIARENLFLFGPPGTAKSALVHAIAKRLKGNSFDYLLTRFTEPNELFGPFDIAKLKDGDLVTNTQGMLPEADLVFLDELFNANSAILNNLLMALNEKIFRRGKETYHLPALSFVGASNNLPEDQALDALFDRFLLRVDCGYVPEDQLRSVLVKGWQQEKVTYDEAIVTADQIRELQQLIPDVDLAGSIDVFLELILKLRNAGIEVSDRRAVRLQRVIASSAILSGRMFSKPSDLWILRYIWSREEQIEVLNSIVTASLEQFGAEGDDHPASSGESLPDPEKLSTQLQAISEELASETTAVRRATAVDEVRMIASRVEWLPDGEEKAALNEKLEELWAVFK